MMSQSTSNGGTNAHLNNLQSGTPNQKVQAMNSLAEANYKPAIPLLIEYLNSGNEWLRTTAVEALTALEADDACDALARLLHDPSPAVRSVVAESLGRLGHAPSLSDLLTLAEKDPDMMARAGAIEGLGWLAASEAFPTLSRLLNDPGQLIRYQAAWALGRLGRPESVSLLLARMEVETDSRVLLDIYAALYRLRHPGTLARLLALLSDEDLDFITAVANVLAEVARPEDAPVIIEALQPGLEKHPPAAFHRLLERLRGWGYEPV